MVTIKELVERIKFWERSDRIGPDILSNHWRLYFKSTMRDLCSKKFHKFGDFSEFRPGAYAEGCSKISIGNYVVIRPNTFLFADPARGGGWIIIEDKVLIGPGVHFYTNNHNFSELATPIFDQGYPMPTEEDSIVLREGCWIGGGVILLPGVEIGRNSVVAAGSIVTKSVPDGVLVAGNPARVIKNFHKSQELAY